MASLNDIIRGFSSVPRTPAGLCHFASRSRATRSIVFGSGVTSVASERIYRVNSCRVPKRPRTNIDGLSSANKHAAHPNATFRNGSLGQQFIDVLFGFARRAARVPQKDVRVEEMVAAIGLTRARIRLGKWGHLKFHRSLAEAGSLARASSIKAACSNPLNKGPLCAFQRGCNRLDMNQGRGT